jgi:hypothetical protein
MVIIQTFMRRVGIEPTTSLILACNLKTCQTYRIRLFDIKCVFHSSLQNLFETLSPLIHIYARDASRNARSSSYESVRKSCSILNKTGIGLSLVRIRIDKFHEYLCSSSRIFSCRKRQTLQKYLAHFWSVF